MPMQLADICPCVALTLSLFLYIAMYLSLLSLSWSLRIMCWDTLQMCMCRWRFSGILIPIRDTYAFNNNTAYHSSENYITVSLLPLTVASSTTPNSSSVMFLSYSSPSVARLLVCHYNNLRPNSESAIHFASWHTQAGRHYAYPAHSYIYTTLARSRAPSLYINRRVAA